MRVLARPKARARSARLAVVGLVAATACLGLVGGPASATVNSCGMSQFPAKVYSMSSLKVACTAATASASAIAIHDFSNAVWQTGSARVITATTTNGSAVVNAPAGAFSTAAGVAGDLNRGVSGSSIPPQNDATNSPAPFIKQVNSATQVVLSKAANATGTISLTIVNSTGRSVYDVAFTNGNTTLTSATANFTAADVGEFVYATGIRPGTKIASRTNATTVVLTQAPTATVLASATAKLQITDYNTAPARFLSGVSRTNLSKTITSASAVFDQTDRGVEVIGNGIPLGTYVDSVATDGKSILMTKAATSTLAGTAAIVVGKPSPSAPQNGETISLLSSELNVNPLFVEGFDSCAENTPEGFAITGKWYNPGSFVSASPPTKAVGEIVYTTGVVAFSAFIVGPLTDAANPQSHHDITFASVPTSAASCAGAPSATTWSFNAIAGSQSEASRGTVRAIVDAAGVTPSLTVTGKVVAGATTYTTTCTIGRLAGNPGFTCGNATTGLTG